MAKALARRVGHSWGGATGQPDVDDPRMWLGLAISLIVVPAVAQELLAAPNSADARIDAFR